jgi:hypothetical protein
MPERTSRRSPRAVSARSRFPRVHHWMGQTYTLACLVGGLAGGSIALFSASGLVAGAGFFVLAICWLFCTVRADLAVRAGDYVTHQRWMTRSFSLAFAAVMLRIYLPVSLIAGIEYADAYPGHRLGVLGAGPDRRAVPRRFRRRRMTVSARSREDARQGTQALDTR